MNLIQQLNTTGKDDIQMTNTELLQARIDDSGLKRSAILQATGIKAYSTLRAKVKNESEFTANEIQALCDVLRINTGDRDAIFFAMRAE